MTMKPAYFLFTLLIFTHLARAESQGMLLVDNPARPAAKSEAVAIFGAIVEANDMVPVGRFDDDLWPSDYRTRAGDNLAVGNLRVAIETSRGDWTIGYFYRQDWLLRASRDSVDARYLDKSEQLTSLSRNFDLDYSIRGFAADGLRLALSREMSNQVAGKFRWGVAASLLRGQDVRLEQAKGSLVSQSGSGALLGNRQLINTHLQAVAASSSFSAFTPAQVLNVSDGWGYALDLGLSWDFQNGASLALAVNDLFGRIKWDRVPFIEQNINGQFVGNTFSSGANAIVSGVNRYDALSFELDPKLRVEAAYPYRGFNLRASVDAVEGYWFPQLGASYRVAGEWQLGIEYETRFGSAELRLRHPNYYFALRTQDLSLNDSRVLGLSMGLNYSF